MAQGWVVPAAGVVVGMMAVLSGETRSAYADLSEGVVGPQVSVAIARGWVVA